jgi:hypothetical protein
VIALALAAHIVLLWPGAPGVDVAAAHDRAVAAGHQVVDAAPLLAELGAAADAAQKADAAALARVESRLAAARASYVAQRFDAMTGTLDAALDEERLALATPAGCPLLWEVAFQLGLAGVARRTPEGREAARRHFAFALAVDDARRPDRALYGADVQQRFAESVAEVSGRAARPTRVQVSPPDARVAVDCKPLVDPGRPPSLRPGKHLVHAAAPGHAPQALLVEVVGEAAPPIELNLVPDGDAALAAAWSEGTLAPGSPSARAAMLAAAARHGARHVYLVAADGTGTLFSAAGVEPLAPPAPLAPPGREPRRSVLTRWWFWTGVGAAVAGAVILGVALSSGGGGTKVVVE